MTDELVELIVEWTRDHPMINDGDRDSLRQLLKIPGVTVDWRPDLGRLEVRPQFIHITM